VRAALAFLTPLGGARTPSATTPVWFPVVGAIVGAGVGGAWWGAYEVWESIAIAAAIALVVDLALTGMLHVDGLADSADGLLPHLASAARRLEVMAAPDVGAFGVAVVGGTMLVRFAALASTEPDVTAVIAVWAVARAVAALVLATGTYARGEGLATAFAGGAAAPVWVVGAATAVVATVLAGPAAVVCAGGAYAVVLVAHARVGGYTGDVLGAAIVVGETAGLLVVALP
jgi:adenosylcobinamide-GDP ribazoletransferase